MDIEFTGIESRYLKDVTESVFLFLAFCPLGVGFSHRQALCSWLQDSHQAEPTSSAAIAAPALSGVPVEVPLFIGLSWETVPLLNQFQSRGEWNASTDQAGVTLPLLEPGGK